MLRSLINIWKEKTRIEIMEKVKLFFKKYSANRHKVTTMTPGLHCENCSVDDNRYDQRQFLYNNEWKFQFGQMKNFVGQI